jgi:chorismate synthase
MHCAAVREESRNVPMNDITIRALREWRDYYEAVEMQQYYWGDSLESVVPAHMLHTLTHYGGHVLGAFDGSRMVGVLIGLLGTLHDESQQPTLEDMLIASKRMFVLPEYRGHGIAYHLKLAQRELALRQGLNRVVWTFDPVLATNAHFNIRKLGALCQRYTPDYYGTEPPYAVLGTSDRLVVEWWVKHNRVQQRLDGRRGGLSLQNYLDAESTIVNPAQVGSNGLLIPAAELNAPQSGLYLVEIPPNFEQILTADESLARDWRAHVRDVLQQHLSGEAVVTDFLHEEYDGRERAYYVLSGEGGV